MSFLKKISVIIVTYNGVKWLDKCILPLYNQDNIRIIVIDNNSSDNTIDKINLKYPNVVLIESKENLGFGKANNLGFNYAIANNFDYVFLLNQDASISPTNLFKLIDEYSKIPDVGVLSPIHYKNEIEIENIFQTYLNKNKINTQITDSEKNHEVDFVNAALWLISVKNLKLIGGFNPVFSHYGEDVEFINRVHYFKKKTIISLDVKGFHFRDYNMKVVRKSFSSKVHFGPWNHKYYIILLNNHHSLIYSIFLAIKLFFKSLLKHLLNRNFNSVKWDFKIFINVLKMYPMIIKTRNLSKEHNSFLYFKVSK